MSVDVSFYNKKYLENPSNDAEDYGVGILAVSPVGFYYRVIGIHHLKPEENRGNRNIYVDVLDEDGRRMWGMRVNVHSWGNKSYNHLDKPSNEPGTNFPMYVNDIYNISVGDSDYPTESVTGLRSGHPDEAGKDGSLGNTIGHHSFYIVYQLTDARQVTEEPDPVPPVEPTLSLEETIVAEGKPLIIPLNPGAMFYQVARKKGLGERLSPEYDVGYRGRSYRAQVYEKGVLWARLGDWENTEVIERKN